MRSSSPSRMPFPAGKRLAGYAALAWFVVCFLLTLATNVWYAMPNEHLNFDLRRVAELQPILRDAELAPMQAPVALPDSPVRRLDSTAGSQSQDFANATRYLQQRVEERRSYRARHGLDDWGVVLALALFAGLSLPIVLFLSAWAAPRKLPA